MPTNLERITEHNTRLAALEEVVDGLPEAGFGGGGTVETCTVEISINPNGYQAPFGDRYGGGAVLYNTVENGNIVAKRIDGTMTNLSIECVCGSSLLINEGTSRLTHTYSGLEELAGTELPFFYDGPLRSFKVTANPGETATLVIDMD